MYKKAKSELFYYLYFFITSIPIFLKQEVHEYMCILSRCLHLFYPINLEKINKCYFNFFYFYSFKKIMKKYISIFMYAHQKLGTKCQIHANCKSHGAKITQFFKCNGIC